MIRNDLYIDEVLQKCEALKRSGLWASEPNVRPRAWIANFTSDEDKLLAAILLDNFVFYSDRATDQLLRAVFNQLEDDLHTGRVACSHDPRRVLLDGLVTPIEGERPNPSDSGNTFCRKARLTAGIDEVRIVTPARGLELASATTPIIFLDDFLGSGEQFVHTWEREYSETDPRSFRARYATSPFPVFVVALVATKAAVDRIHGALPDAGIAISHVLDDSYSVKQLTPPDLLTKFADFQASLRDFLQRCHTSLNIPEWMKRDDWHLFGMMGMGLLFSFEHGTPDSSLPVLWAHGAQPSAWTRLVNPR